MAENVNPATIQDQEDAKVTAGRARAMLPAADLPDKVHTWPYLFALSSSQAACCCWC